ncbi:MAG: YggT family protein [Agarilytica sp.]
MNLFSDILTYITQTIGLLYIGAIILRFFLQVARADFYNPFSQAIVKITNPALIPMRRIIPGVFGIDVAAIVLAIALQFLLGELNYFIITQTFFNPLTTLLLGTLGTLKMATYLIFIVIIVMVISSFVAPYSNNPIILLARQLLEPLMRPIHRIIPPMGGLDFSVLFIGMGNVIIQKILDAVTFSLLTHRDQLFLLIGY